MKGSVDRQVTRADLVTFWACHHRLAFLMPGYLLLAALFCWELLVPGRSLYRWDTLLYNWPVLVETRAQILAGHLPFWTSAFCCGTPLLENINAGVLYPLRALCWLLPVRPGYHLFLFAHVWLSFVGMHLFIRRGLRLGRFAAIVGALAYGASGYARGMWDTHNFMALPWIPMGLWALLEARRDGRWLAGALGAAACWSGLILCGDFQAACVALPVAAGLVLFLPERSSLLRAWVLAALLAALLTAPQWLPAWEHSLASYRVGGLDFAEATKRSFHPFRLAELLFPYAFGTHGRWYGGAFETTASGERLFPWTASASVGLFALLAAALSLRKIRRPMVLASCLLTAGALLLSFGRHLPGFSLWLQLPVVGGFRYPEKYLLWATLGLAMLGAHGADSLRALWCSERMVRPMRRLVIGWGAVLALGLAAAVAVLKAYPPTEAAWNWWIAGRGMMVVLFVLVVLLLAWRPVRAAWVLPVLLALDLFSVWVMERPTTNRFDPLDVPAVAEALRQSDSPAGRVLRDHALTLLPLPAYYPNLSLGEKKAVAYREMLAFNSPAMWGLRTIEGFSPVESGDMRELRLQAAPLEGQPAPPADVMAESCKRTGVEWLLTTPERLAEFRKAGLPAEKYAAWGPAGEVLLARIPKSAEAEIVARDLKSGAGPRILDAWRPWPGFARFDLAPGSEATLLVKEAFGRGWRAKDQDGDELEVTPAGRAFTGVRVPAGTAQVRMTYVPPGWSAGLLLGLCGLAGFGAGLVLMLGQARLQGLLARPIAAAVFGGVLFLAFGVAARGHWACTFDEGFHLARGLAAYELRDTRLSYFHPPLQNLVGGYFADLALGHRVQHPDGPGWGKGDVFLHAVEMAAANRDIFPDLVQSGRWGTSLFSLILCLAGAYWASRWGGPMAGWLAAFGLALNPVILSHGSLCTTDMAVTALVVAGTAFLWRACTHSLRGNLVGALVCFALAPLAKHTGLIWFAAFLAVCVPWLAWRKKEPRVLWLLLLGPLLWLFMLVLLYGPRPQEVRLPEGSFLAGKSVIAGRYFEGLMVQGGHAVEGHRAYFAGETFMKGRGWHMAAAVALKMPALWLAAGLAAVGVFLWRRRPAAAWIPWVPALSFALLLFGVNRMAIGVRHALPLVALLVIGASVWAARLSRDEIRRLALTLLLLSSVGGAVVAFPYYLSAFPLWAGGMEKGYRWLVDSNYDWGQELPDLERNWAALTVANKGVPPNLAYYGFVDPRVVYRMRVGPHSYGGFMDVWPARAAGREAEDAWRGKFAAFPGATAASISAIKLGPYDVDFARVCGGRQVGRIGLSYFVYFNPE